MHEEKYRAIEKTKKAIFVDNFLGGIGWGLGVTVGVTILVAILSFALKQVNLVPIVGNFVLEVQNFISQNSPKLR